MRTVDEERGERGPGGGEASQAGEPSETGALVAVVSCEPALVRLMHSALGELGLRVQGVPASPGVARHLALARPILVLLDVTCGQEAVSWQILDEIRQGPDTAAIPVIACATAPWLLEERRAALEEARVRTWSQPYDPADLLRSVLAALEQAGGTPSDAVQVAASGR